MKTVRVETVNGRVFYKSFPKDIRLAWAVDFCIVASANDKEEVLAAFPSEHILSVEPVEGEPTVKPAWVDVTQDFEITHCGENLYVTVDGAAYAPEGFYRVNYSVIDPTGYARTESIVLKAHDPQKELSDLWAKAQAGFSEPNVYTVIEVFPVKWDDDYQQYRRVE